MVQTGPKDSTQSVRPDWLERFPALRDVQDPAGQRVLESAQLMQVPPETTVFRVGDACRHYLLVLEGSVKVRQTAANGREIILYRVGAGDSCVLTTSCLLSSEHYAAEGITETEVTAIGIPASEFHRGVNESPAFRQFVFARYGQRLADLMILVEEVAFGRLEARLAQRLLRFSNARSEVTLTHQELATEIGSAREVVSRQLKDFERQGWVRLHRGRIEILDRAALEKLDLM